MASKTDRAGDEADEFEQSIALEEHLHDEMIAALPLSVKRRIKALKKLQFESTNIESKFFEEVHALECKYHALHAPLYDKRSQIIVGKYEPDDEECDWHSEDEDLSEGVKSKINFKDVDMETATKKNEIKQEEIHGIPDFWLTIFKNVGILSEMVQEHDEPILKHLIDIKIIFLESNPMGFILEFHFSENEYFSNTVLMKHYEMKCAPETDDPFAFEGPEIFKSSGCIIDWKKGKNVTLKTVKKKQKHKSRGVVRTVTEIIPNDSFFKFFSPPAVPDNADDIDEETRDLLTSDFEIGHYIRERIVPRAVLYFTGEGLEDEDFEEEEDEDDEEGDEDED